MEMCLNPRMNTIHCNSTGLQADSAGNIHFTSPRGSSRLPLIPDSVSFSQRVTAGIIFLFSDNKTAMASLGFWGRTLVQQEKRLKASCSVGQIKTSEVMLDPFIWTKWNSCSLSDCRVSESGDRLHHQDARVFPLRSQRYSASHTHKKRKGYHQWLSEDIFHTVRSQSSENKAKATWVQLSAVQAALAPSVSHFTEQRKYSMIKWIYIFLFMKSNDLSIPFSTDAVLTRGRGLFVGRNAKAMTKINDQVQPFCIYVYDTSRINSHELK